MKKKIMILTFCSLITVCMSACAASGRSSAVINPPASTAAAKNFPQEATTQQQKAAGTDSSGSPDSSDNSNSSSEETQIPSPFTDYSTIEEAAKAVGFDLSVPEKINGYAQTSIQAAKDTLMIQIFYGDGEEQALIRKAGSDCPTAPEDISGDYTYYEKTTEVTVNGRSVTLKGNGSKIYLATWSSDGYDYNYSLHINAGMKQADFVKLIKTIK